MLFSRIQIEGIMPERALLRLKRSGIPVYNVKKSQKNCILLTVNVKDVEKVFAFYPNVCYNNDNRTPYVAKKIADVGLAKWLNFAKNRLGLVLGCLLAVICMLYLNTFTFGVKFVGSDIYAREGKIALARAGNKPFTPYKKGKEDLVASSLLSLDGVEYCSVKKEGLYIRLEMRINPFVKTQVKTGNMCATHTGVLRMLTVLKGTPSKKAGEEVKSGDTLVENVIVTPSGGQVCVEVIARAVVDCIFEGEIEANTMDGAFAAAYLAIGENAEISTKELTEIQSGLYHVKIGYTVIETMNF